MLVEPPELLGDVVLTEKNLSVMKELMEQLDEDGQWPLAKRIRNEVVGAGEKFRMVTIKFPGAGAYDVPLDDPDDPLDDLDK